MAKDAEKSARKMQPVRAGRPAKPGAEGKAAAPMITLKQIAAKVAEAHGLQKKQAEAVLDSLASITAQHLKAGERVRLTGLGVLQVRNRPARSGRNPATGEAIEIAASKKIAFRASKELQDTI